MAMTNEYCVYTSTTVTSDRINDEVGTTIAIYPKKIRTRETKNVLVHQLLYLII